MSDISILIAGDYSPKERFQKALDDGSYKMLFPKVANVISSTDYSVITLRPQYQLRILNR